MKCLVLVKATKDSEAMIKPSLELMKAMGRYNQELLDAGILTTCGGLRPTSQAKRIRFSGAERTVIDGPFSPETEQVAGLALGSQRHG